MKLHWSPFSPFARKVMVVAHEVGLADKIRIVRTQVSAAQPNAELLRENPLSKIPTLVLDDGTALYDSPVICEYLDGVSGSRKFFPAGLSERIEALRWQALGDGLVDFLVGWRGELTRPEEHRLPEYQSNYGTRLRATLSVLESEAAGLERSGYAIGHVAIACALAYLDLRFDSEKWRHGHDRLAAWHEVMLARPGFQATASTDDVPAR